MVSRAPLITRLSTSIGAQILASFGVAVVMALVVALISLSATKDATDRLENLQEVQRRMVTAVKDLELGAELQSDAVQAFLLSGDERYLRDQQRGRIRFADAFEVLSTYTLADEGLDWLDEIARTRQLFEDSASSQLALYRQGWQRSATFLWRTEGQESKEQLERRIDAYRFWYEAAVLEDVSAAQERGRLALLIAITLVITAAVLGLVLGIRLSRSLARRLGTLTAAAGAIERDDFSARAIVPGRDEVATLANAMNRMAVHLEESQRALEESRLKLRESLEQYRLLAENAMDIVYALDVAGRYMYVNKAVEMVAGYKPEEMIGRHFSEFLPEALQPGRQESFERRMRGEDEGSSAEIDFRAKDGRLVPLELRLAVIKRDGEIVGMQGIARDVTRRRSMEAEIRRLAEQERRRADQLQEAAHVGQRIARLSSLDVLLPNVVTLLHERFGYERVAIFLIDKDTNCAVLRAWAGDFAAPMPKVFSLEPGQGLVGTAALLGETIRTGDVQQTPQYVEIPATVGTRSEIAVPIRSGAQLLGVLAVGSKQLDAFDVNDEAMLVILSRQIATVIQNSRLFEQQHSLAVAEERNRLAREIHDTLAQGLTGITLQLEVADALLDVDAEQARAKINKALELTRANLEEARRSVMDLRAAPLQERTLPAALEELVGTFGREHELRAAFGSQGVAGRLPAPIEAGLYRIVQEALNNIAKHADPSAVEVVLEEVDGELVLAVEDDGGGFDPSAGPTDRRRGGFGLVGMKERARLLGGELEVNSSPGHGTQIVVRVPAPKVRAAAAVTGGSERR